MNTPMRQRQDAQRLQRLNELREQRALSVLEHRRTCVQQAQEQLASWHEKLLELARQSQRLSSEAALRSSMNIDRLHDADKLDKALVQDREALQIELARAQTQLDDYQAQLVQSRQHWQQCRARAARLSEKMAVRVAMPTVGDEFHHDQS